MSGVGILIVASGFQPEEKSLILLHRSKDYMPISGFTTVKYCVDVVDGKVWACIGCGVRYTRINDADECECLTAGVAQSAEQVIRNDEAVGSTPTSSSNKGLTDMQLSYLNMVVQCRLQLKDAESQLSNDRKHLDDVELTYKINKKQVTDKITDGEKQVEQHSRKLLEAEQGLRQAVLEEAIISGPYVPESKPKADEVTLDGGEEPQLGRDE